MIWIGRLAGESKWRVSGMRPPASDRMLVEPEQLLHAQRNRRAAFGFVVDRRRGSGRRLEMGRRFVSEAPRQVPGQRRVEGAGKVIGADLVELRLADEERRKPARIGGKRLVRQVRPRLALGAAQEHHPVPPLLERFRPRQAREAKRKDAARQRERGRLVLRDGERLLGKDERAEPAAAARPQRCGGAVEAQFIRGLDRAPAILSMSSSVSAAAVRIRAEAARPAISPMARYGSPANGSCASSAAARPLAMRNSPRRPRAIAMRSGKAEARRAPAEVAPSSGRP